ncbi:Domain of uncharacterised function (DUF397) [Nocardia otitidiscaviarum]|uniref:Domain of uncharacterized function (DUF397) n=1 Tax=Nocardia otitidiscaviarum TaxID=1823 RepID=A0A378YVG5_9NOCA|nr:DUF397 domain-containing protein [Nocardia otitidiscaviarum]SUA81166.1 Domain of uncharacterised function (DUF397) [Nocardia otitidiscaviarum]
MSLDLSGASWFKSSYSQPSGECVEAAYLPDGGIGVRDSKNVPGPALVFGGAAWDAFTAAVRAGHFDLPGR